MRKQISISIDDNNRLQKTIKHYRRVRKHRKRELVDNSQLIIVRMFYITWRDLEYEKSD